MPTVEIATTTISLFVRHNPTCPKRDDPQWKRCKCRKSLYIYENGKVRYQSAKTRSWEQAEKVAQQERDARDPVKRELVRIAAEEEAKKVAAAARETSIEAALDQWIAGFKSKGPTASAYATFKKTFLTWAESKGFKNLTDVTSDALDAWVGSWSPDAKDKLNRIKSNTQSFRLTKIRSFFKWAAALRKLEHDPALVLRPIAGEDEEETQPLTPSQFSELLDATYRYDADRRVDKDRFGADLRAVFLVQRWTGVRLVDALMLPRSGVCGDRLIMKIQKTGGTISRKVPAVVVEALNAVPARKRMHPDQFFWSRKCDHRVLSGMWTPRVRLLNGYLNFKNEQGEPMRFRSHMLRDTYAVQMLLAGVSLDKVSRLLGHASVRVTERHYSPWVKSREDQLEEESVAAMERMGAVFID
jgi:integrase/recombinase XerD